MPSDQTTRSRSSREVSRLLVIVCAGLAAIGGAFAGCHPSGSPIADPIETAAFAAGFTVLASRASRNFWLVIGVTTVLLARGWLLLPALATVAVSFGAVFLPRSRRRYGAALGALGIQVVLRWPATLFHGFPSLVALALVALVSVSAWQRSSRRSRRRALLVVGGLGAVGIVLSLPALIEVASAKGDAQAAESAAHEALSNIGSSNTAAVTAELRTAASDATAASSAIGHWFTLGARLVPIVAQQERFLAETTSAAARAAQAGAEENPAIDYHRLGYHDGSIDLSELSAMQAPMRILRNALAVTDRQLTSVDSPWLIGPLNDRAASFRADVAKALHGARLAVAASKVLPAILGGSGTRNYFVAFMTPSEARGYDGLVGSYGILTATNGHIHLTSSGSIADIQDDLPPGGATLSDLTDFLARYGAFHPGLFPQDASYSPDLPTVSKVLEEIYEQSGGGPIDGVLALDPIGLAALLHFTGPVQVSGLPFPLTQQNAAKVLLTEQYTTFDTGATNQDIVRHDFLQGALHSAFDKLVSGSLPAPDKLGAVLGPVASQGRISFWSFHADEQPFLRQLGIDGAFPRPQRGDLVAVTAQNSGNNKIDAYLHTSVSDNVTYDPSNGAVRSALRVHLRNAAPRSGLPPIVIDSPADPGLPSGTNRTWLTIYSPLALTKVSVDGKAATVSTQPELGVRAYSLYVDVPASRVVTVEAALAGTVRSGSTLPITVRDQPSANPQVITVSVSPIGGWHLTTQGGDQGEWVLSQAMTQRRVFQFAS